MKRLLFALFFISTASILMAQVLAGEPDPADIGVDTAQQLLVETSVSKFEDSGLWFVTMPRDQGNISIRRIDSVGSVDKEPVKYEDEYDIAKEEKDQYVLGLKVNFYRRGFNSFALYPVRPIPIEGITKTVSVWVIGRNTKHVLKLLISDQFGHRAEITMGSLNFSGWKKLTVAIPTTIIQKDYHYANRMGIKIEGLRVECDPLEAFGTYYIYFDDMRAMVDLFAESKRDTDDLQDNW